MLRKRLLGDADRVGEKVELLAGEAARIGQPRAAVQRELERQQMQHGGVGRLGLPAGALEQAGDVLLGRLAAVQGRRQPVPAGARLAAADGHHQLAQRGWACCSASWITARSEVSAASASTISPARRPSASW